MLPRRPPIFTDNADDDLQISELLRTGEASRLRRRGAIHGHSSHPTRTSYVTLTCGAPISSGWKFNARKSCRDDEEMSPLPQQSFSQGRTTTLANIVESTTTGCGAVITTRALVSRFFRLFEVSSAVDKNVVASLDPTYLDDEQKGITDEFLRRLWGNNSWTGLGCRACGNIIGFRYRDVHSKPHEPKGQWMFFPSAVTPSKPCVFPESSRSYLPPTQPDMWDSSTETPLRMRRASGYVGSAPRRPLRYPTQGWPVNAPPYPDSRSRTSSSSSDFFDWYTSNATRGVSQQSDEDDERVTIVETEADTENHEDVAGEFHSVWTRVLPLSGQPRDDESPGWNVPIPVFHEGPSTGSTPEVGHEVLPHYRRGSYEDGEERSEAGTRWNWLPNEQQHPLSWFEAAQIVIGEPPGLPSGRDNMVTTTSPVIDEHGTSERNQVNSPPLSPRPVSWSHRPLRDIVSEVTHAVDSLSLARGSSEIDLIQIDVSILPPDMPGQSHQSTNGLPTPTSPSPAPPAVSNSDPLISSTIEATTRVVTPSEPMDMSYSAAMTPIEVRSPSRPSSARIPSIASHPRPPRETPPRFDSPFRDSTRRNSSPAPRGGSAPPTLPHTNHSYRPIIPPPPPNLSPLLEAIRSRRSRVISHGEEETREGRSQSRSWRARHSHVMRSRDPDDEERRTRRRSEIAHEVQTDSEPEYFYANSHGNNIRYSRQDFSWPTFRERSSLHVERAILRPEVRRSSSLAPPLDGSSSSVRPPPSSVRRMTMPAFFPTRPPETETNLNDETTSEDSEDEWDSAWWRRSWSGLRDERHVIEDKDEDVPPDNVVARHHHSRHHEAYLPFVDGSD